MNEAILLVMADAYDRSAADADEAQAAAGSPTIREYHRGQRNAYADAARRLRSVYETKPSTPSAQRSSTAFADKR